MMMLMLFVLAFAASACHLPVLGAEVGLARDFGVESGR
jgi:hypothetical protein